MYGWLRLLWADTATTNLNRLGKLAIHDENPYHQPLASKPAGKITFDSTPRMPADADAWLRLCEKEFEDKKKVEVKWTLNKTGGGVDQLKILKALRVPYFATDKDGKEVVEHLLVGYHNTGTAGTADFDWVMSISPTPSDMEKLGSFLISQVPANAGDVKGTNLWDTTGLVKYDPDPNKKNACRFREVDYKAEIAISIPFAVRKAAAAFDEWRLIVGYEGGAGY